jgi:hypothetical protein
MKIKVSVIIPLYNKAPYIARAVRSVLTQTWRDFELLVVDDGSTDGSSQEVARLADPRLRLLSQANAGPGAARNRGLAEARGEYVAFLDADDEWRPDFLAYNLALLEQAGPRVAVVAAGYLQGPEGVSTETLWRRRGLRPGIYRLSPGFPWRRALHLLAFLTSSNTLARTAVLRRWGGFFDRQRCLYGEDSFLWLKILLQETVLIHFTPLAHYHTEASALAHPVEGPRPVEPILQYAEEIEKVCPEYLHLLLRQLLAARAARTACLLTSWGRWREGRQLLRRFCNPAAWRVPSFVLAQLAVHPLGVWPGRWLRCLRDRRFHRSALAVPGRPAVAPLSGMSPDSSPGGVCEEVQMGGSSVVSSVGRPPS